MTSNSNNHNSPTTTSNSRTTTTANSLHNRALTHEESRNLMSGGTILEDLADNPTALTHTITPIRKEVFTSLFFLIGDSRSVFTSGVRHDSAEAMSLLTTILNPRGPFARSAVAQELCTFIASIGLSGLRRLRLDRHILSNKDGVAPACVAFITALSIASSDLTASALLCGNSEAESRMKSLASSYARGASANNNDSNNNFASSSSSSSMNNRHNNQNANGLGANASSSSSSNLNTNNMNQPDDPLLRRDLQPHETARPHRNQNLRGAPVTPVVPTAGASSSSSNARSSRYAHLPTTPAGQQIAGSNPAYVRGATEVVINLTAASVPSAVRTHARAFGLGGRSAIPKVMVGADLEKRKCLPLKLIFPGLNDNNNADGNRGDKTTASAANNGDESSRTTIVTSIHHDPNENTSAKDDDNEENARNTNESGDNNNKSDNNKTTTNNNNLITSVSRVLSNAAESEFPSSSQVVNRRDVSRNKNRKNNERVRRRGQHNQRDDKKNENRQDRRLSSSKTNRCDRRRNNSHTKNTGRSGNDNGDDDDDHDQNNKNKSQKQRALLPDNGNSVVTTTITNRRHNNNDNDDDDDEDIVVSPENSHDGDDEYEEYEEYDDEEEEEEETSDYSSTDGNATRSDDSRNNSASSYDDDDEYSSGYEYEEDYESESDDEDDDSSSADDHSSNAEDDDDDDENFRSGSEGENDRNEIQRHEIRTATWLSRQGENERRKDNNKTHRNGNDNDDDDDQEGEHNDSRRQQHRQINRIKRDPKRLTRSQRKRRRRRQRRLLQQLEAGTTTTSSANNQENTSDNNNNDGVSSPKDKNNDDDGGDGERHNVRPIMNVRRQDAREATREAEAAAIKGNIDNKINSPTGKRERRNQQSSLTTAATISTNGTSFPQRNENSNKNNNNPEIVSSSSNNSSAFQTPDTRSRKGSFVAAAASPSLVLPPKNPAFDRQQQQQQQRPSQLSGSELSPKRISQQQLVQQQIVKPLFDRFFTRIVNNNNNTNSPTDSSSTFTVEAAPTSLALAWHTPSSSNPFSSYKIVFAPLKRRGCSVPTLGICCGQKHTVFVVGNGEPQMSNQPPSTLTSLTFPSSPNSPSSTSANGNFSNNNSSTFYNISPSSIMIACSGDNTKSQCGLAASAPIFPGSIENNNNNIPNKNSLNSTTSPGSISSSSAAASSQQKTQSQRVQLHSNRQFLSVGSSSRANLVQVLSGSFFSACVTATGEVYLWGDNHYGQCSVGSSLQKKGPLQEQPNKVLFRGNKVTQISCGATFVIALTEADKVLGWGSVHLLGIGTGADSVPCEKTLATTTTTSSANNNNNANNSAATATSNNNNSNPLFYLPTESEMQQELISSCSTVPCSIAALCGKQITNIASGNFHSIAVTKAGVLYSWGFGGHGQLGIGTISNSSIPKKLDPSHFSPMQVETVYCGANHSAAVAGGGAALWMWGDNRYGQCGVSIADSSSENFLHNNNNNQDDFLGNKNSHHKCVNSSASFDSNTGSATSSSSSSRRSPDAAILVPTRVRLNFKQRASIVSVACGNHRTCVLFSDGDVAIWGQQIPFSTFSGGGNCSGYSAGTGYHNVFATPALLTPQLAISQISARYDHIAVNSAKRDFAVITIGMIPGCASGSSGEFGVRIEFLTCAPPPSSTKSASSGLINGGNHFSPSCSSLLNSWTPLVGLDEGSDNNNSEFSNSTITTTANNNNQSIASIAAAQHLCFGNPICVGVGGSHTLIGIGYVRSSSQIIVNTTTNSQNNQNAAAKQTATTTISSIGGGGSFAGTQTESQQNQIIQSCVLSYGTGTWGQLGLGKHLWKYMSSSSSLPISAFVAPSSPASPSGALQRNSNSNATLSNNSFATSNSSQQNQTAAAAAVSQLCPILFSTSPQVSSPYFHKSSVAPAPPPLTHINSNSPLNKSGSANNSFGQPSQIQNNNNSNTPNSPSNANNNNNTRNAASSAPSNQSANTNSSNNTSTSTSPGVKLTLRGLTCGHAFCFALFSAPVTSSSSSAAGPPSTNLEDTVVYFWGNNNHHQSGVPPPPPTLVNQHLDKVAAMQVKEINANHNNNNSGRSPNSDNNNSNPSEGTTRRGSSSSGEDHSSNGRSSGQSNTSSGGGGAGGGDSYPQAPMVATKYDSPVLVPSLSGKGVAQIVAGSFFAMALTSDGNVYAWGLFDCCGLGQFADFDPEIEGRKRLLRAAGTNYASTQLPPPHASVITTSLTKEQRTCVAFPLRITDKILGEGAYTTNSNHYPASSSNLIVRVAAGPWHAAVLTRRGEVYTWGFGTNHRLGLGADDIRTHLKPVRVALPVRIRDISCGHANTLAISVHDSSLYVWGDNEYGQCGANSASNHHHNNFSSTAATATSVPEPIKVISNGVRSAAITKTCCIAVMWNGAVLISGILENQNSSSTNNTTTTNNTSDSSSTSIPVSGVISSKNSFVSIQVAVMNALKHQLNQRRAQNSASLLRHQNSSLRAQPGVTVGITNQVLTLFPAPPPTSAFLDDDDDDDDAVGNEDPINTKKNENSNNDQGNQPQQQFEEEEVEMRSFYAHDVVASTQHACLIVEINRPGNSEWNNFRRAVPKLTK